MGVGMMRLEGAGVIGVIREDVARECYAIAGFYSIEEHQSLLKVEAKVKHICTDHIGRVCAP